MRAIVAESGTDLAWREVEDVTAEDGEVIIEVVAAGINRADLLQAAGNYPPPPGASTTIGLEVSGRISALGPGVTSWSVGQPVCALLSGGGYAERVAVPAGQVMPIPDGVGLHEAAGAAGGRVHGVVEPRHDGPSGRRPDGALPRRRQRHRHPRHSGGSRPGVPRRRHRGVGRETLGVSDAGRRHHHQLPRRGLRRANQGRDRRSGRRRHPGPHGRVLPRPQHRRAGARRPPRRHRLPGRSQGRTQLRQADGQARCASSRRRCGRGPSTAHRARAPSSSPWWPTCGRWSPTVECAPSSARNFPSKRPPRRTACCRPAMRTAKSFCACGIELARQPSDASARTNWSTSNIVV